MEGVGRAGRGARNDGHRSPLTSVDRYRDRVRGRPKGFDGSERWGDVQSGGSWPFLTPNDLGRVDLPGAAA